eukprot:7975081-Heterocapsa_arctica.AAC.1
MSSDVPANSYSQGSPLGLPVLGPKTRQIVFSSSKDDSKDNSRSNLFNFRRRSATSSEVNN